MTDPDFLVPLSGRRYRLYASNGDSPETFSLVCPVTSLDLQQSNEFDDLTTHDCNNPDEPSARVSDPRVRSWSASISGTVDATRMDILRSKIKAEDAPRWEFRIDLAGAAGGGSYFGAAWIENYSENHSNRGLVQFSATLRGEGDLADFVPAV